MRDLINDLTDVVLIKEETVVPSLYPYIII